MKDHKRLITTIFACVFAAAGAVASELSSRKKDKELEDLKERVNELEIFCENKES